MQRVHFRALTWDDPRGFGPLTEVVRAYNAAHPFDEIAVEWDIQPLSGFESRPIDALVTDYDIIVADHPHMSDAAEGGYLVPVEALDEDYVGVCEESYRFANKLWAVPVDAACHVSAYRPELMKAAPRTWREVERLADSGVRIGVPLAGVHSLMALLTIIASQQPSNPATVVTFTSAQLSTALDQLSWLKDICIEESLEWNPIEALHGLATGICQYLPITFGYEHFQKQGIRFTDVPAIEPHRRGRGVIGGAGMAVSAVSKFADEALQFCKFCGSKAVQTDIWPIGGGQPAHRAAWNHLAVTNAFYRDTRLAIGTAVLRPRCHGFNGLQSFAGAEIQSWLATGTPQPPELHSTLDRLQNTLPA